MKRTILAILLCLCGCVSGAPLSLVENGIPKAVVVLEKNPTCAAQLGAYELNHHLKMVTGVELPIIEGDYAGDHVQVIIRGADIKPGAETIVRCDGKKIYLTGFDSTARRKIDYGSRKGWPRLDYDI